MMSKRLVQVFSVVSIAMVASGVFAQGDGFEERVAEYLRLFPYQDTYDYSVRYTGGDPSRFNAWVMGEPALIKAGEDKVVRTNNDTFYEGAFVSLAEGPVILRSKNPSTTRFVSFQLMDDRNVNYRNVIHPDGAYTLWHGEKPARIEGEAIEVPSEISFVLVRVEVKDKEEPIDIQQATQVFNGIEISGPTLTKVPELDLLSGFDDAVEKEAHRRMDETFQQTAFRELVAGKGDVPEKVSYLRLAAGTKGGWGGPVTSHSSYEMAFFDEDGEKLIGRNGPYTLTTEEPPVDAFWSLTIYDTERGGFLHPNKDDRYHINNTNAVKNDDGTVTFLFKQSCASGDQNCLEVPAGEFDVSARYYLPREAIQTGAWTLPKIQLVQK